LGDRDGPVLLAHRDGHASGRAHHDAFDDGLTADVGLVLAHDGYLRPATPEGSRALSSPSALFGRTCGGTSRCGLPCPSAAACPCRTGGTRCRCPLCRSPPWSG